jgi:peptide/nickel transport system permease protein
VFGFLAARLIQALVTLLAVSVVVFALAHATGNPADVLLPLEATGEQRVAMIRELGLDRPLPQQYLAFLSRAVRADFGKSLRTKQPAMDLVADRFWPSITLASTAMAIAVMISLPLGVMAAVNRTGIWDRIAMTVALLGQSLPSFFTGVVAIFVFSVTFELLPAQGSGTWAHYVLPSLTLGWFTSAGVTRLVRSSMLEVLDSEFVKLARTKGLSEAVVVCKHALRNALIPVITFIGYMYGVIIAAAIATETVFGWPGLGRLAYEAVTWRDYPLLQAVVLVWATLIIGINLLVDVAYGVLDPRIRR